jgi:hypothetical protein
VNENQAANPNVVGNSLVESENAADLSHAPIFLKIVSDCAYAG